MRSVLLLSFLLAGSVSADSLVIDIPRIGGLCVLESPDPASWVVFPANVGHYVTDGGKACFIDTSDQRERWVVAVQPFANIEEAQRFEWSVRIGGDPNPDPNPNPNPNPPEPIPDEFTQWIAKTFVDHVPASDRGKAKTAAKVYRDIAANIGGDGGLFTGPEIRLATTAALLGAIDTIGQWSGFVEALDTVHAKWGREEYRDPQEYRDRWNAIADGLESVAPPAATVIYREIEMVPQAHQIRDGRLYLYQCARDGQPCRWLYVGDVHSKRSDSGKVYVTLR